VTKTGLAPPAASDLLRETLSHLTAAPIAIARDGVVDPAFLLDDAIEGLALADHHDHEHAHSDGIASFTVMFDRPLPWPVVEQAMAVLTGLRGADLLRVKGLVAVEGCRGPVVVHAVQHVAHRPVELEDWPGGDRRSRLVFITRNIGREAVERLFAAIAAI
jgi:G3E family GTPase